MQTVFISSTVHDLKEVREVVAAELERHGYKLLLSERGDIPVDSQHHSYEDCIRAAKECDILVGIIDGRFGGEVSGTGKSITQGEIESALDADKKVYVFVRQRVLDAKEVLRPYLSTGMPFKPSKIVSDHRVFDFIDSITHRDKGNWLFQFNAPNDLLKTLAGQLGFTFSGIQPSDADRLDELLAEKALRAFAPGVIEKLSEGIQCGSINIAVCDRVDDAATDFSTNEMKFANPETATLFDDFMREATHVLHDSPKFFHTAVNPAIYVMRESHSLIVQQDFQELCKRSVRMNTSWSKFYDHVRQKWPGILVKMHEATSEPVTVTSQASPFKKVEEKMPTLFAEMRNDIAQHPLWRRVVLLKKGWSFNGSHFLVYYYEDHPDLKEQFIILRGHQLVEEITTGRTEKYLLTEPLVEYLQSTQS